MSERAASSKSADAYRTISEVAEDLGLPQHVLRFWETRFTQVKPLKRAGGRRFYRPEDVDLLRAVKALLYNDGYTIKGVQRMLRDQGPRSMAASVAASPSGQGDRGDGESTAGIPQGFASAGEVFEVLVADEASASPESRVSEPADMSTDHRPSSNPDSPQAGTGEIDLVGRLEAVLADLLECQRLVQLAAPD